MHDYRVAHGKTITLADFDPDDTGPFHKHKGKAKAEKRTAELHLELEKLQERLYAGSTQALLIVLQALDTGGKDGTIKHVMSGVNPQGCSVASFKVPSANEAAHDFLWRVHAQAPAKGHIGIFNRSHYEDVLVTRVHRSISSQVARKRFDEINDFERLLTQNSTTVVKFFLHISKDEQRKRLQARVDDPAKHWKFSLADLSERRHWNEYQRAFAEVISATSTRHAPWHIVPANHKWYRNYIVSSVLVETLKAMNPQLPPPSPDIDFAHIKID